MKRIEFIAPVEAMRGNLSGAQKLEYPTDNLGAYEGPMGSVNYARNYQPRFVGAKIAKSGKKYFAVRLRTANHLTAKSKKAMALLGGAGSIYAALISITAAKAEMDAVFAKAQEFGETRTFRQFWMDQVRQMLVAKAATKHVVISGAEITIKNPWVGSDAAVYGEIRLSQAILVKFWSELASNPISFKVEGVGTGVAHNGDTFEGVITSGYNNLGLTSAEVGGVSYVKIGEEWLQSGPDYPGAVLNYITEAASIATSGTKYVVTNVAPTE